MGHADLMALAAHPLDLRVLDLLGTTIATVNYTSAAGGIYALLYRLRGTLEELRLCCVRDSMEKYSADIVVTIAQVCRRLTKLELAGVAIPLESVYLLCTQNGNLTELRCCASFTTAADALSACEAVLDRMPRLEHISFTGNHPTQLPTMFVRQQLQTIVCDEGSVDLVKGIVVIRDSVAAARAQAILTTLPCTMQSITYSHKRFSSSAVLQIAQMHGSHLEKIFFEFAQLTMQEWKQIWAMCPHLKLIKNAEMTLDIASRCYRRHGQSTSLQGATTILLAVPVSLLTIQLNSSDMMPTESILAIAQKHGATLKEFGIRLRVGMMFTSSEQEQSFQHCPLLQHLDLSNADTASLQLVASHCTRAMTQLILRDGQQVKDAALTAVLDKHPQLTHLTLINCSAVTPAVFNHFGCLTTLNIAGRTDISRFDMMDALAAGKFGNLTTMRLDWDEAQMLFIKTIFQLEFKSFIKTPSIEHRHLNHYG